MFCINCKYPLEQVRSLRCPECGRAFDPAKLETFLSESNGLTIESMKAIERTRTSLAVALGTVVLVLFGVLLLSIAGNVILRAL